jgi:hypothetical protein
MRMTVPLSATGRLDGLTAGSSTGSPQAAIARRIERCTGPDNCAIAGERSPQRDEQASQPLARRPPGSAHVMAFTRLDGLTAGSSTGSPGAANARPRK